MSETDARVAETSEPMTADEARECVQRFIHSHFDAPPDKERARISIPADLKRDDDIRLMDYIENADAQLRARDAEIERLSKMLRDTGYGQGQIDAYVAQCEEIERLRAVVDKLPRTADGVPVVPGMTLYQRIGSGVAEWASARLIEDGAPNRFNLATIYGDSGGHARVCMCEVFSTRAAAQQEDR